MDAVLVRRVKRSFADGYVVEIVIWKVPVWVQGGAHRYKYRLFFGTKGRRVVGYDNERGKGDHRHLGEDELVYRFVDLETLEADFRADVESWRKRQ